jgi:hypothetical protein
LAGAGAAVVVVGAAVVVVGAAVVVVGAAVVVVGAAVVVVGAAVVVVGAAVVVVGAAVVVVGAAVVVVGAAVVGFGMQTWNTISSMTRSFPYPPGAFEIINRVTDSLTAVNEIPYCTQVIVGVADMLPVAIWASKTLLGAGLRT